MDQMYGYEPQEERSYNRNEGAYPPYPAQSSAMSTSSHATSPPHSASPFAFAPPPLAGGPHGLPRPQLSLHQPDPAMQPNHPPYYGQKQYPQQSLQSTYPSPYSSTSMAYRSYSTESVGQKAAASPASTTLSRTPNLSHLSSTPNMQTQSLSSPYNYQKQLGGSPYNVPSMLSPQPRPAYPYMQATEMPRSLSYPSYAQPYPSPQGYLPSSPYMPNGIPPLKQGPGPSPMSRPVLGYSFANRLPLVDRPFKCDECVQSFNRNHDLKRHKRIHLAVKPFGCDKCGKTFSRKDALRRHWLVKGCRGEDGATAPIVPMFPVTGPSTISSRRGRAPMQTQPASPPTPPRIAPESATGSNYAGPSSGPGYATAAPAGMSVSTAMAAMPSRSASDQSTVSSTSTILVTPNEIGQTFPRDQYPAQIRLDDPIVIDSSNGGIAQDSEPPSAATSNGYFDLKVNRMDPGVPQNGMTASPYSRNAEYVNSPRGAMSHPYQRKPMSPKQSVHLAPGSGSVSPTSGQYVNRPIVSPVTATSGQNTRADGRPMFAVPATPDSTTSVYSAPASGAGAEMLGIPQSDAESMERQNSAESDPATWARWHRPSFPFPAPTPLNYEVAGQVAYQQ